VKLAGDCFGNISLDRIGASMAGRNYSSSLRLDYADNNADIISLNLNPFAKNLANLGISCSNE